VAKISTETGRGELLTLKVEKSPVQTLSFLTHCCEAFFELIHSAPTPSIYANYMVVKKGKKDKKRWVMGLWVEVYAYCAYVN
jgi:hypothetical protein